MPATDDMELPIESRSPSSKEYPPVFHVYCDLHRLIVAAYRDNDKQRVNRLIGVLDVLDIEFPEGKEAFEDRYGVTTVE